MPESALLEAPTMPQMPDIPKSMQQAPEQVNQSEPRIGWKGRVKNMLRRWFMRPANAPPPQEMSLEESEPIDVDPTTLPPTLEEVTGKIGGLPPKITAP